MEKLIIKFGGTSVGSASAIKTAMCILLEQAAQREAVVCVVSAMAGVTNLLLEAATKAALDDQAAVDAITARLRERHHAVIADLLAAEQEPVAAEIEQLIALFVAACHGFSKTGCTSEQELDALVSIGERMNARIVAAVVRACGYSAQAIDATELIVTNEQFGNADPLFPETRVQTQARLMPLLQQGIIPIVTGFIGATRDGAISTLGRGGSDYSASILGVALDAAEIWICTDVDGVLTANPKVISNAQVIPTLTYAEAHELAHFGAAVLHPRTMEPAAAYDIPLRVCNTFNAAHPGTLIITESTSGHGRIKAVTATRQASLITVAGQGAMSLPALISRTFAIVAQAGAQVLLISQASATHTLCFVVPQEDTQPVVEALEADLALSTQLQDDVVVISVVGEEIAAAPTAKSHLFKALNTSQIPSLAVSWSGSSCNISLVVPARQADSALRSIHQLVISQMITEAPLDAPFEPALAYQTP